MVLPLYDENPTRTFPLVTITLIITNILIFVFEASLPDGQLQAFINQYAFTPQIFSQTGNFMTIFSAMFMHGGFVHLGGNMLYLWIFGNNVEDALGHLKFLVFYLAAGVIATFAHYSVATLSAVPSLGASGAIAGVLGGYLILFPRASVVSLVPFIFFFNLYRLPAILVIGLWFIVQSFSGYFSLASATSDGGGVAWFAHIGGFLAGIILIVFIPKTRSFKRSRF